MEDFPGSAEAKNPPANAREHRFNPWFGKVPCTAGQLRLCVTTTEAHTPKAYAPKQEKPPQ